MGLSDSQGRHEFVESIYSARGRLIDLTPFIIVIAASEASVLGAVWGAFGMCVLLLLIGKYRNSYNPAVPFPAFIVTVMAVLYLVLGVVVAAGVPVDRNLITPVIVTTLTVSVLVSMIVQKPFTMQYTIPLADPKFVKTREFLVLNQIIASFWLAVFVVMLICVWLAYVYFPESGSAGRIALAIVVPILLPVIAGAAIPQLLPRFKAFAHDIAGSEQQVPEKVAEQVQEEGEADQLLSKS